MNAPQQPTNSLTISCRFIPYDQWLTTHFDPSWKVKQVKLWILAKCITSQLPDALDIPPRHRPASPITFAPHPRQRPISPIRFAVPPVEHSWKTAAEESFEHVEVGDDDNDDNDDEWYVGFDSDYNNARWPTRRYHSIQDHNPKPSSASSVSVSQPQSSTESTEPSISDTRWLMQYTIIRFATGQILEDDFPLSWYAIRSYELLEVHRAGVVLRLPRELPSEYIQPYFEARVRVLRAVSSNGYIHIYSGEGDEEKKGTRIQADEEKKGWEKDKGKKSKVREKDGHGDTLVVVERGRSKKQKIEWKERWAVIRSGVLNLCKDENDPSPQRLPLSTLSNLRGPEHLASARLFSPAPHQHILCAKFRSTSTTSTTTTKDKLERSVRGGKGKDTAIRVYASDFNIHTRTKNEECGLAATTTNPETSAVRLRPKSFEVQRDRDQTPTRGIDLRKEMEKANSRAGPSAMIPSALPSAGEVKVRLPPLSSPTTRSFGTMKRGESGEGDEDEDEGEWIILDMRDDAAYTSILRILHRHFPQPISSTFISAILSHPVSTPANTPIASPVSPSSPSLVYLEKQQEKGKGNESQDETDHKQREDPMQEAIQGHERKEKHPSFLPIALPPTFGALPYPEWRTEVVGRAQRAGVGDVGRVLGWVLYHDREGATIQYNTRGWRKQTVDEGGYGSSEDRTLVSSRGSDRGRKSDGSLTPVGSVDGAEIGDSDQDGGDGGSDSDGNSETSEAEWEGWMGDLERQGRVNAVLEREGSGMQWRALTAMRGIGGGQFPQGYASSQRLFQQGRRALEPSAIVTPLFNSVHHPGSTPTTSSVSGSISSFGLPSTTEASSSAMSADFDADPNSNMSIDEAMKSGCASTTSVVITGGGATSVGGETAGRRMTDVTKSKVNVSNRSPRQRSATVTNSSVGLSGGNGGLGSMFSRRKGKEKERGDEELGGRRRESVRGDERPKLSLAFSAAQNHPPIGPPKSQPLSPTVSSAIMPSRPRASILRHVRSGSSLYGGCVGSTSLDVSEQSTHVNLNPDYSATGGTRKAGRGIVRGVSGKFAKGLDAALDFVDAR